MLWRALVAVTTGFRLMKLAAAVYNGSPIGLQRWILDRANPRFLVGVNGVGVDPDGRVILARHRFGSPHWRLLGGFISRDESFQDALRREIREETGLEIEVGPVLEANTGHRWARVEVVYAYRVIGGRLALTHELAEVRPFAPGALPEVRADQRGLVERHAAAAWAWARERREPATLAIEPG